MALASQGARVVLVGRSRERSEAAVRAIQEATGSDRTEYLLADMASMDQVRQLAADILARYPEVHVLANNAGAYYARRQETAEGNETTFALNVLAPFLLTTLLRERLIASTPARVINTASAAHQGAKLDVQDLQGHRRYGGFRAYGRSKLALILLTHEFARRFAGTGVTVNAFHPGFVASRFGWNNGAVYRGAIRFLSRTFGINSEAGADTLVYLATAPEGGEATGRYFFERRQIRSSDLTYDDALATALWEACEKAVEPETDGASTPFPHGGNGRAGVRPAARA